MNDLKPWRPPAVASAQPEGSPAQLNCVTGEFECPSLGGACSPPDLCPPE